MDNFAAMQQTGAQKRPPQTPPRSEFASLTLRRLGGGGSPLPNPHRRLTIDSNHGNERRHSHRKPKDGLQEGTRTVGNHGNGQAITDPKKASGEKRRRRSCSILHSKSLRRCSSATGERGKINPFGPSSERGLSSPIKRLSGTGSVSTDQSRHIRSPIPRADTPRTAVAAFWGRERIG